MTKTKTKIKKLSKSNINGVLNTHLNTNKFREMTPNEVNTTYKKIISEFDKLKNISGKKSRNEKRRGKKTRKEKRREKRREKKYRKEKRKEGTQEYNQNTTTVLEVTPKTYNASKKKQIQNTIQNIIQELNSGQNSGYNTNGYKKEKTKTKHMTIGQALEERLKEF